MTDKRIPLDAQYGYAKVEEITPEQWEAFKDVPYVAPIKETMGWEECSAIIKESLQVQKIHLDAQQIIKAAVHAIEDIMPATWNDKCYACWQRLIAAGTSSTKPGCLSCDILSLKPILKALKGLIDEQV